MGRQIKRHREIEEKYRGGQVGREKGDRSLDAVTRIPKALCH